MKNMNDATLPLVSVITVNYNGLQVTRELLRSLDRASYPHLEIIVVDNASRENPEPLAREFPAVRLIRSDENLGFAGGNNLGLRAAKGDYFLLLNNDTEVPADFLQPLVKAMQTNPAIGIVSPKIIYHHTPDTIQYAGGVAINPYTGRGSFIGQNQKNDGRFDQPMQTELAHGAAMMISRQAVEKAGLLPEQYFLYYEEIDFCEMVKKAGFQIWYIPSSTVFHKESMTVGKENPLKTYYMTRNRIIYLKRNTRGHTYWLSLLFFMMLTIPKSTVKYMAHRKFALLKSFYRGLQWHVFNQNDIYSNPRL